MAVEVFEADVGDCIAISVGCNDSRRRPEVRALLRVEADASLEVLGTKVRARFAATSLLLLLGTFFLSWLVLTREAAVPARVLVDLTDVRRAFADVGGSS